MKKLNLVLLSLLMMSSLTGCMNNDKKNDTTEKSEEKDTTNKTEENTGSISDVMTYMKENGIEYSNEKKLSNFDWAAKEGTSFTYDDKNVYLYQVDGSNAEMQKVLTNVQTSNAISANQNGVEKEYSAIANGNYLMIYDKEATLDELANIFNKYKADNTSTK